MILGVIVWLLAVRIDAVLEAKELPTGVAKLYSALSDVEGDHFSHCGN
jgi:hypothetical protein